MSFVVPSRLAAAGFGLALIALGSGAARAEAFSVQPLEGGSSDSMFQDLPGVHLNDDRQNAQKGCSQRDVSAFETHDRYGTGGTMTECNFGHFSIQTFTGNGTAPRPNLMPDPTNPFGIYRPDN